jgi:hypothetical protein
MNLFKDKETYSLNIITNWLKEHNIPFRYAYNRSICSNLLYEHGIRIDLKKFTLSVQTHPIIAGWAFVETLKTNDMLSDLRHKTPEDFFKYLEKLIDDERDESLSEKSFYSN